MPSLTVVMPNYNYARYLKRALDGIVKQSRPPDEFLVLDDASTDESYQIMQDYARQYDFIRLFRNEKNLGVAASMRKLIGEAKGDYIFSESSDDYTLPGFFEEAMRLAESHPEAGVICGGVYTVDSEGRITDGDQFSPTLLTGYVSPRDVLPLLCRSGEANIPSGCGAIFRKDVRAEVGDMRPELVHANDQFAVAAAAFKYGMIVIARDCAVWTRNTAGMSQTQFKNCWQILDIIGRVVWLMRSPPYRDRFPEEFIQCWENTNRRHFVDLYTTRYEKRAHARLDPLLLKLYTREGVLKKVSYVLDAGARKWVSYRTHRFHERLVTHKPDLSCYGVK